MIERKTDFDELEKCADEVALGGTNKDIQQLLRDAASDLRYLDVTLSLLEEKHAYFGEALFRFIEPHIIRMLEERPTSVDVMTVKSIVRDMINDEDIVIEVDSSDIEVEVDRIDVTANVDSLELRLRNN